MTSPCLFIVSVLLLASCNMTLGQITGATTDHTTATLTETSTTKTLLYTVTCQGATGDIDCDCVLDSTTPAGGPFVVEKAAGTTTPTLSYTGAGGLDAATTPFYAIDITCQDVTDKTASSTLKVNVDVKTAPYSFDVYPDPVQNPAGISEFSVTAKGLVDILCVGNTGAAVACTCSVTGANPAGAPFNVQQKAGDKYRRVYYTGTGVSSSVKSYVITVTCIDDALKTSSNVTTVTVNVDPDQPPYFPQYPSVITGEVSATGTKVGTTVYTASALDPETNAITYNMTQSPNTGYFSINSGTGVITLAKDLRTSTNDVYRLTVQACDTVKCGQDLEVVIPIKDLNTAPVITNLPSTVNVPETASSGTVIETLTITDAQGDTINTDCSAVPAGESYKFQYNTNTQTIKLATPAAGQSLLDYEKGTIQYKIVCVTSDSYLSSTSTLTVNVENVNEAPKFSQSMYFCTLDEGNIGSSSCYVGLSVTDEDAGDTISYSILNGNNSQRFNYLVNSNRLTLAVDYDVDNRLMPQNVIITVQAKDQLGLKATSQISVTVNDVNDKTCKFGNSVQSSTANQGTAPGNLGTFTATDDDLTSPNNKVTYQTVGGSSSYMYLLGDGTVQLRQQIPASEHGKTFYLLVKCVDGGTPPLSATATYALTYLTTTTTTTTAATKPAVAATTTAATTTSSSSNIFDDAGFVAVFAILMSLLALALISLLAWLLCCGGLSCCGAGAGYRGFGCQNGGCQNGGRGCEDCCNPRPLTPKVRPRDSFFDTAPSSRVSRNYKDFAWNSNDVISDGTFGGGRSAITSTHTSSLRALPAPNEFY